MRGEAEAEETVRVEARTRRSARERSLDTECGQPGARVHRHGARAIRATGSERNVATVGVASRDARPIRADPETGRRGICNEARRTPVDLQARQEQVTAATRGGEAQARSERRRAR